MPIVYQNSSAAAYAAGTTALTPSYPTGVAAGNILILLVGYKPSTANTGVVTTPAGWTAVPGGTLEFAGGFGTTVGADTGNTSIYAYYRVATSALTGTFTVTWPNAGVIWGAVMRFTGSGTYLVNGVTASDITAGNVSATFGSISLSAGDEVVTSMVIPTDVTTPAQFSNYSLTATGITFGTVTETEEPDSSLGNDIGGFITYADVLTGSGTVSPTLTVTAAGTTTAVRGPLVLVRIRETLSLNATAVDDSTDEFGAATLSLNVTATAVDDSVDAFGTPAVRPLITATAVDDSTDAFGSPSLKLNLVATAVDDSTDAFGAASLRLNVAATAVDDSVDAFGSPIVRPIISATAVDDSTDAFGIPTVNRGAVTLEATAVNDGIDGFGIHNAQPGEVLIQQSAFNDSEDQIGTPTLQPGAVWVSPDGLSSTTAYGTPAVSSFRRFRVTSLLVNNGWSGVPVTALSGVGGTATKATASATLTVRLT